MMYWCMHKFNDLVKAIKSINVLVNYMQCCYGKKLTTYFLKRSSAVTETADRREIEQNKHNLLSNSSIANLVIRCLKLFQNFYYIYLPKYFIIVLLYKIRVMITYDIITAYYIKTFILPTLYYRSNISAKCTTTRKTKLI